MAPEAPVRPDSEAALPAVLRRGHGGICPRPDVPGAGCVLYLHPAAAVLLVAVRIRGIEGVHLVPGDVLCHDH